MKVVDIERVIILMRFIQFGWNEERKKRFDDDLRLMLETQCEDLEAHDAQVRAEVISEISKEMRLLYENEYETQIRAEAIDEIFEKANEIQKQQIENLTQSSKRNGKMWAIYMVTYLGHIQTACTRLLKEKQ